MRRESSINLAWALTIVCALYLPTARSAAQQYSQPGAPVSQWGGSPDTFTSPVPANLPYSTQGFGTAGTERQRFFNARFLQESEALQQESSESEEGGEEQEGEEIETDRDSLTPAVSLVRPGRVIVESAYTFLDNREGPETHSFPELLVRYGLSDRMELRLGWNHEIGLSNPLTGNTVLGLIDPEPERESKFQYGSKFLLTEQAEVAPSSSLIIQGYSPTSGESSLSTFSATHVFGWQLRNGWVWDSAVRYGTSGFEEDRFNTWTPSTVVKIPLGNRIKAHSEYFGIFSDGREIETVQHYVSPGVHYLINPNTEFGVRVAWGLNDQSANFLVNVGFGWMY